MPAGRVKFYNIRKSFGFITLDEGGEVYFNRASLRRDREFDPVEGDRVECEIRDGKLGKIAHRIEMTGA